MSEQDFYITDFLPEHAEAFKRLNEEWISNYFTLEEEDVKSLNQPQEYIIDNGGFIKVAVLQGEVIGVCAMIKMKHPDFDFELAKMAVTPKARGKQLGFLLARAVLEKARSLNAKRIYLVTNSGLAPALGLYRKLGFTMLPKQKSAYRRGDVQMECRL